MGPPHPPTLRGRLLLLITFVILALLALGALGLWQSYRGERGRAEGQLRDQAIALALTVDREFDRAEAALRILAESTALARDDLDTFEAEIRVAAAFLGGAPITLTQPDGSEIVNILWLKGERRPDVRGSPTAARVFASGRAEISNLHWGPVAGRLVISISVPVFPQGSAFPAFALTLSLGRDGFVHMLAQQVAQMLAQPGTRRVWSGAVLDRAGHFVARTQGDPETAGQPASPTVLAALAAASSGVISGTQEIPEGVRSVTAFARAPESRYAVLIGVPEEAFLAPLYTELRQLLGVGALIAVAALLLALALGWRIVAALRVLAMLGQADDKLAGSAVPVAGLQEVDDAARALTEAIRRQALLIAELNHRVKNTLATVQSLAVQTLRGAGGDMARFSHDFGQRLHALAAAHDLLAAHAWGPADFAAVAHAALDPWRGSDGESRIALEGPEDIAVAPRQAQAIVLALHELATNAVKHGALSRAGGRVTVCWSREPSGAVIASWAEMGGPTVAGPPQRRGFGTRLLERALAQDLGPGATVELSFEPAGLRALIRFTPSEAETGHRHHSART